MATSEAIISDAEAQTRVFISYSRKNKDFASWLRGRLIEADLEAYLDAVDIAPGEDWRSRLGALIERSDVVVFVVSPHSAASPVCAWEVEQATLQAKRILPVVRADVPADELPAELSRINFVFMRDADEADRHFDALVAAIAVDIQWIRRQSRLGERALEWDRAGRPNRLLLRGADIGVAEEWRDGRPPSAPEPSELQRTYIAMSRRSAGLRLRVAAAVAVGLAVVMTTLAGFALVSRDAAVRSEAAEAAQRRAAQLTESRLLARASQQRLAAGDASAAVELALWGLPRDPEADGARPVAPEARRALWEAMLRTREHLSLAIQGDHEAFLSVASNGSLLAGVLGPVVRNPPIPTDDTSAVYVWTREGQRVFQSPSNAATGRVQVSADGEQVVAAMGYEGTLVALDRAGGSQLGLRLPCSSYPSTSLDFSPDGSWFVAGCDGVVFVADRQGAPLLQHRFATRRANEKPVTVEASTTAVIAAYRENRLAAILRRSLSRRSAAVVSALGAERFAVGSDAGIQVWARGLNGEWASETWLEVSRPRQSEVLGTEAPALLEGSDDGRRLAASWSNGDLAIFERGSSGWSAGATRVAHAASDVSARRFAVAAMDWNAEATRLVTAGGNEPRARVWSAEGEMLFELAGHSDALLDAAFLSDGSQVVTASRDGSAIVWSASGRRLTTVGGERPLIDATIASEREEVVLTDAGRRVRWFELRTPAITRLDGPARPRGLAFVDDDRLAVLDPTGRPYLRRYSASGARSGAWVEEADFRAPGPAEGRRKYSLSRRPIAPRSWSADGQLVVRSQDNLVYHYDFRRPPGPANPTAVLQDDIRPEVLLARSGERMVVWGRDDEVVKAWFATDDGWTEIARVQKDRMVGGRISHDGGRAILFVAGSPDQQMLGAPVSYVDVYSVTEDAMVRLHRFERGAELLDFAPDGRHILFRGANAFGLLAPNGTELERFPRPRASKVTLFRVDPESQRILTWEPSSAILQVWRFRPSTERSPASMVRDVRLVGHRVPTSNVESAPIADAAFGPGMVVTGGADRTLRVWDEDGNPLFVTPPAETTVTAVAVSPDGAWIAGAFEDGTITIVPAPPPLPELLARGREVRDRLRPLDVAQRCAAGLVAAPCDTRYTDAWQAIQDGAVETAVGILEAEVAAERHLTVDGRSVGTALGNAAFGMLFVGRPESAEQAAREALALDPSATWIETNLAHALILQDRVDEALSIHRARRDDDVQGIPWPSAVASDIGRLRKAGVDHEGFQRVLEELGVEALVVDPEATEEAVNTSSVGVPAAAQ